MKRIVALASGRGSNFQAVLEGIADGRVPTAEMCGLVVDRVDTGAAAIARQAGVELHEIAFRAFSDRSEYDREFAARVGSLKPDLVLALGYMRIFAGDFVRRYAGRLMNIHPSLLPAFPGMKAQKQAFDYGVRVAGCTVHFVDEGVDTGPVILQAVVSVDQGMSLADLERRIQSEEHRILVEAVGLFCRGAIRVEGRKVIVSGNG